MNELYSEEVDFSQMDPATQLEESWSQEQNLEQELEEWSQLQEIEAEEMASEEVSEEIVSHYTSKIKLGHRWRAISHLALRIPLEEIIRIENRDRCLEGPDDLWNLLQATTALSILGRDSEAIPLWYQILLLQMKGREPYVENGEWVFPLIHLEGCLGGQFKMSLLSQGTIQLLIRGLFHRLSYRLTYQALRGKLDHIRGIGSKEACDGTNQLEQVIIDDQIRSVRRKISFFPSLNVVYMMVFHFRYDLDDWEEKVLFESGYPEIQTLTIHEAQDFPEPPQVIRTVPGSDLIQREIMGIPIWILPMNPEIRDWEQLSQWTLNGFPTAHPTWYRRENCALISIEMDRAESNYSLQIEYIHGDLFSSLKGIEKWASPKS